jgi:hypothetical protein
VEEKGNKRKEEIKIEKVIKKCNDRRKLEQELRKSEKGRRMREPG